MNVVVNGLMTNYQKIGKGKSVIFLHGWADSSVTFSQLMEKLKDYYTCYALDLPGFGGTQAPQQAWGLKDYADFVKKWQEKVGITKTYAVVGHSFGGSVAIVGVAKDEIKADKLVLLSSAGIRGNLGVRKTALRAVAKAGKLPLYVLPARRARTIKERLYKRIGSDALLLPHMIATFRKIVREDVRKEASAIRSPSLLIYGDKDRETPLVHGRILSGYIRGSKLKVLEGGHFLHQEKSDEVSSLINSFLGEAHA